MVIIEIIELIYGNSILIILYKQ